MATPNFISSRDRDAWSTIRGFVYQAELIVAQWLELPESHVIELELGEDIDVVRHTLDSDPHDISRLLQQVKHSERSVTLRKQTVTEFLAAAIEHRHSNPHLDLAFRYVTNVAPGTERPTPLSPPCPAILRWQQLCSNSDLEREPDVGRLLQILQSVERPPKLSEDTWSRYKEFLNRGDLSEFASFMKSIHWSTGSGDLEAVVDRITNTLVTKHSCNTDQAILTHSHLFEFVFSRLAIRGVKRLSGSDLTQQIQQSVGRTENASYARIASLLERYESRLSELETTVQAQKPIFELVARGMGLPATLTTTSPSLNFAPPPPPAKYVSRPTITAILSTKLHAAGLIALTAAQGVGKTQLARELLAQKVHTWVRLNGRSADESAWLVQQATTHAERMSHSVLVLDGLGNFSETESILDDIEALAHHFCLVVTCYSVPVRTRQNLSNALEEFPVPLFDVDATRALLETLDAPPDALTLANLRLVLQITRGHPQLIHALARYLISVDWSFTDSAVANLLSGSYAADVKQRVQRLVLDSIPDVSSRELLYRLDLVIGEIREREVMTVSSVEPGIPRPGEKLLTILGPWAQRDSASAVVLSPLVADLSRLNLDGTTRLNIYRALAHSILSTSVLDEFDAVKAILYSANAEEFELSAAVYMSCAFQMPSSHIRVMRSILPSLWLGAPLPPAMSAKAKLLVRAAQVRLLFFREVDVSHIIAEMETQLVPLLDFSLTESVSALVFAASVIGTFSHRGALQGSQRLLRLALSKLKSSMLRENTTQYAEVFVGLFRAICVSGSAVLTVDDLFEWMSTMAHLDADGCPSEERSLYVQAISAVSYKVFAADLEVTRRNIPQLGERLGQLARAARSPSLLFVSSVYAIRIRLEAEAQNVAAMHSLYSEGMGSVSVSEEAEFTLRAEYTERLFNRLPWDDSVRPKLIPELERLVNSALETNPSRSLRARLMMSAVLRFTDSEASWAFMDKAELYAGAHPGLKQSEILAMLGEKAIAVSERDGLVRGFDEWHSALEIALDGQIDGVQDKKMLLALGHCTGYYSSLAHGIPITKTLDGEDYGVPSPGMFLRIIDSAVDFFRRENLAVLAAQMCMFAEDVQNDACAERWGRRVLELTERQGASPANALLLRTILPFILLEGAFSTAVDLSVESARAILGTRAAGPIDVELVAQQLVMVPLFLRLATLKVLEDPAWANAFDEVHNVCMGRFKASGHKNWTLSAELSRLSSTGDGAGLSSIREDAERSENPLIGAQARVLATLLPRMAPAQALVHHVAVLHFMAQKLAPTRIFLDKIVVPFLLSFWRRKLHTVRFRFVAPTLVEQGIDLAASRRGDEAVRSLLSTLLVGLPISVPPEIRAWLNGERRAP